MNKKFCDKCGKEIKGKYVHRWDRHYLTESQKDNKEPKLVEQISELCLKCASL